MKPTSPAFVLACFATAIMSLASGCASGGFDMTRRYARFINSQNIIIRIILYILTSVVFFVTMLVDLVVNNTIDFWNGTVSAGDYKFKDGDKTFYVRHEILNGLKRSTIDVRSGDIRSGERNLQHVVLQETAGGEINLFVDGKLRTTVTGLQGLPIATIFDVKGNLVSTHAITDSAPVAKVASAAAVR